MLLLVFVALLLVRLPSRDTGGEARPAEGGRLTEAIVGSASRINPLDAGSTAAERDLAVLIFAGLTRPGPDSAPHPVLAESWEASGDARVFVFRLRSGLRWHDGQALTVEDVLFTVEALAWMGDRADPRLRDVWLGATLTRVGADALRVELPAPFGALPSFASFGVLPAHLLHGVSPDRFPDHAYFRAPVGAGPFRLVSLTETGARLDRFGGYALGAPYLDGIDLRFVTDSRAATAAVQSGDVDAALVIDARADGVRPLPMHAYTMVLLNQRRALFNDERVRRALALAIDRTTLASLAGSVPLDAPFPAGSWAADGLPVTSVDVEAGLRLLGAAGWSRGADGVARQGARELAFTLVIAGHEERVARALVGAWAAIGARVTLVPVDPARLVPAVLALREFEAALVTWDLGPDPDPFPVWHSSLRGTAEGNFGDVADVELDRLAQRARETDDLAVRAALYGQFAARFRVTQPGIVIAGETVRYAVRPGVHGMNARVLAEPADRFAWVHRWHLRLRQD